MFQHYRLSQCFRLSLMNQKFLTNQMNPCFRLSLKNLKFLTNHEYPKFPMNQQSLTNPCYHLNLMCLG
jgi:hypothetical protein